MGNLDFSKYVRFESPCPVCRNNDNIYWVHTKDDSHEQINCRGDIKCNDENCDRHERPLFIMEWAFNCGNHTDRNKFSSDYVKPGKTRAINAIHMLANNSDLNFTKEEEDYIVDRILKYKG